MKSGHKMYLAYATRQAARSATALPSTPQCAPTPCLRPVISTDWRCGSGLSLPRSGYGYKRTPQRSWLFGPLLTPCRHFGRNQQIGSGQPPGAVC